MPEITGKLQARGGATKFRPGQSGNPAGRPVGSRNKATLLCVDLLSGDAEAIFSTLIERAKAGDALALKLCVDRIVPIMAARDRVVGVELPDVADTSDLVAASAAVIEHAAAGRITLSEAGEFMRLLKAQRELVETADLSVRIEALETRASTEAGVRSVLARELGPSMRARVRNLRNDDSNWEDR